MGETPEEARAMTNDPTTSAALNTTAATQPVRILIVDDEAPARKRLSDLLDDCRATLPLTLVDEATNGLEALSVIEKGGVDIVLTDIRMPGMDGIEFAQHLSRMSEGAAPRIIFTTAYDEYAVRAFELNAVDYLLKPIKQERLLAALKKAAVLKPAQADAIADASHNRRKHLSIHERGRVVLVPIEDILYLKAELKYLTVRTAAKEYLLEESLTRLEEEFKGMFTRIHRNCIVTTSAISGFERINVPSPAALKSGAVPAVAASAPAEGEDDDATSTTGGLTQQWVCNVRGVAERLPVSRRQQHVIREF
jgi:two-component system, LytTR family, response regulator AlgR